jgi:hypothetical protein
MKKDQDYNYNCFGNNISSCYFNVAVTRKDANVCFERDDLDTRRCISFLVTMTRDPKVCESTIKEKDFCVSEFNNLNEKYFR